VLGAGALVAGLLAYAVGGPLAAPAAAHTKLRQSTPAKDATVAAPAQVSLAFTDRVRAGQARIQILSTGGGRHESGDPSISGDTITQRVKGTLPPGKYATVYWVVSADGHPVKGEIPFTVAEGAAPARPGPAAGAAQAPGVAERETRSGFLRWVWILAGLSAGIGIGIAVMLRRKRAAGS
jgi:copper resistance protein C